MTDNFKAIYRILSSLDEQMDADHVDVSKFDHEQLGITENRWLRYLAMMQEAGYINGVSIKRNMYDEIIWEADDIAITIKGLEYLSENSIMQRMYREAKKIKELMP